MNIRRHKMPNLGSRARNITPKQPLAKPVSEPSNPKINELLKQMDYQIPFLKNYAPRYTLADHFHKAQFLNEHGQKINHQMEETEEQIDSFLFIPSNATVLEIGARYGTVSNMINKVIADPTKQVVIEADATVIPALIRNRDNNGCAYHIFQGAISATPLSFHYSSYGSWIVEKASHPSDIPIITMAELEIKHNLRFDTIVADCEGSFLKFLKETNVSHIKLILLEKDAPHIGNYAEVDKILASYGFVIVKNHHYLVDRTVYINTNFLPFRLIAGNTASGSIGLFGKLGYVSTGGVVDVIVHENVDVHTISAHANSQLQVQFHGPVVIRGYINPTAITLVAPIIFQCGLPNQTNQIVGILQQPGTQTAPLSLGAGIYDLVINSAHNSFNHTIWLISK